MKYADGDIVHWFMVWRQEVDAWCLVRDAKHGRVEVIVGTARARSNGSTIAWPPGTTTHILGSVKSENVGVTAPIPADEWPEEVCVALAKRALMGD